jgi:hypothetical protein
VIRHVAVFRWKPDTAAEQIEALSAGLSELPALIPEISAYVFAPDAGLRPGAADYAVIADFEDAESYRRYAEHPAHRRVIDELLNPMVDSRAAVQLDLSS